MSFLGIHVVLFILFSLDIFPLKDKMSICSSCTSIVYLQLLCILSHFQSLFLLLLFFLGGVYLEISRYGEKFCTDI